MHSYPVFDQTVLVEFRALPSRLWLVAGFEVRVGERVFRPRPGRWFLFQQPWTGFELSHDGKLHAGLVRGVRSQWLASSRRYSISIGLAEVARDTRPMRGWPLTYLMATLLGLAILFACAEGALLLLHAFRG